MGEYAIQLNFKEKKGFVFQEQEMGGEIEQIWPELLFPSLHITV